MSMIEISHLVKKYGQSFAVNDISFSVNEGEVLGFLGPNGAGKTTTMNILTGYLSATGGTAKIAGIDILENPMEAKKHIGFLPEHPPLYPDMTVKEYLNFVYNLKKCTLNRKAHLDEICEVIRIEDVYKRPISHLSKGYRQRVGIAQALIGNPDVLIFDEPTVGLDPKQIIEIRNLITGLGKKHTIILSSHILPEVQSVCGRIVIINKGKIVADAKKAGEDVKADITAKAQAEAAGMIEKAHAAIEAEKKAAIADLQGSVADLSINVAAKLIGKDLTDDEHRKMIERYVAEAGSFNAK